jgi:hypothetical protein
MTSKINMLHYASSMKHNRTHILIAAQLGDPADENYACDMDDPKMAMT